jgi:hypothetical protein
MPTKGSVVRDDASQVGLDELHCDDTVWDEDIQSNKDLHCDLLKQLAMGNVNKPNSVAVGGKQGPINENEVLSSGQQHLAFSADCSQECNRAHVERWEEEEPPKTDVVFLMTGSLSLLLQRPLIQSWPQMTLLCIRGGCSNIRGGCSN